MFCFSIWCIHRIVIHSEKDWTVFNHRHDYSIVTAIHILKKVYSRQSTKYAGMNKQIEIDKNNGLQPYTIGSFK